MLSCYVAFRCVPLRSVAFRDGTLCCAVRLVCVIVTLHCAVLSCAVLCCVLLCFVLLCYVTFHCVVFNMLYG